MNVETEPAKRQAQGIAMATIIRCWCWYPRLSGGGKTTLCTRLLDAKPQMARAVTCTTRPPREGERDGVDYYFLDAAPF